MLRRIAKAGTILLILSIPFVLITEGRGNTLTTNTFAAENEVHAQNEVGPIIPNEAQMKEYGLVKRIASVKSNFQKVEELLRDQKRMALEDVIRAYLGDNVRSIGLCYYDIKSGTEWCLNGGQSFLAGSTVKVQMNMVLADYLQSGQINSKETLKYTEDCYEGGTGILQGQNLSNLLPILQLGDYTIIHSDNIATNMIMKRIGYERVRTSVDEKLGHSTDHTDNYITAKDETALLKQLYENAAHNPYYERVLKNMKMTDFHDRIDKYIPHEIVAHKVGSYGSYVNDVGIIYTKNPFILAIYTKEIVNADEIIAHIAKMVYEYQNKIQ